MPYKTFRKKPVVIKAAQWFKNGDHPEDHLEGHPKNFEGKVVRYFRDPYIAGNTLCERCLSYYHYHGCINTLEGKHIVCPGDWIITGVAGEHYPCKPEIFQATYEEIDGMTEPKFTSSIKIGKLIIQTAEDISPKELEERKND